MKPQNNCNMNTEKRLRSLLQEVRLIAGTIDTKHGRQIVNYCDKIGVAFRRRRVAEPAFSEGESASQVEKRYVARKAILSALLSGRRISLLDSAEFQVSQMHTQMHLIATKDLLELPNYVLRSEWVPCGIAGARCKEYWLEKTEE